MQAEPLLPATERNFRLPEHLMRDRPPHWEKIGRNVYSAKLRPKRRQRDEIGAAPSCVRAVRLKV